MNSHELREWMDTHGIINRTISGFWNYLYSFKNEEPLQFEINYPSMEIDRLEPHLSSVSFTMNYQYEERIELVTCALVVKYNDKKVGMYESLYSLAGDDLDDFLKITYPSSLPA